MANSEAGESDERLGLELLRADAGHAHRGRGPLNGAFLASYDNARAEPESGRRRPELAGHQSVAPGISFELAGQELILDENNLLPFHFLRVGDRIGRAVVKVERGDGASGTGFLVAPDVLLTNHHVLPDVETARSARATANYESSEGDFSVDPPISVILRPEALFVANAALDFAFCGVSGLDAQGTIFLERNSLGVLKGELVNIIQHPRGRPKEVALQDNQVIKADNVVLHYSCDTEPGSSGSPVFNNQWKLVALHHASVSSPATGRRAPGTDPEARFLNEGIRLSAIALWLETADAQAAGRDRAARLRGLFRGLDPQIGFFGALGRVVRAADAAAFVVEAYRGGNDDLDIAYWDLRLLGRQFRDRLTELGWLLADLRIDVWCLAGPSAEHAKMLCEHMETNSRVEYACLAGSSVDRPSLAILYRSNRGLSADRSPVGPGSAARLHVRGLGSWRRTASMLLVPVAPPGEGLALDAILSGPFLGGPEPRILIGGPGHEIDPARLSAFASLDPSPRIASGADGFLAVLPGSRDSLGPRDVYVSGNLSPRLDPSGGLQILLDRSFPPELAALAGTMPVAARLTLG